MDVSRPYSAIAPTLDGDVLVTLALANEPLSGRAVARRAKRGSQPAVQAALDRLVGHGIVRRTEAPPASLYELNRDHVGAEAVELMTRMRGELFARIRREIAGWGVQPVHVSMFGSAARADGDTESDVDLLLVTPAGVDAESDEWRRQVDELASRVEAWTGNRASTVELSVSRVNAFAARGWPPSLKNVSQDGIVLCGDRLEEIVRSG